MQETKNKKYIVFPIGMMLITVLFTFMGYAYNGIFETLEKYDLTGLTTAFMYIMFIMQILILGISIYKGVKGREEGFDYLFSRFACIIFAVFIFIPILAYFIVGGAEAKTAEELEQKQNETFNTVITFDEASKKKNNKSKEKSKIEDYMDVQQNDKFYERKLQIISENKKSKLERFVSDYIINTYNVNVFYRQGLINELDRYYAVYSRFTVINIVCFAFYFASWNKDRRLNKAGLIGEEEIR